MRKPFEVPKDAVLLMELPSLYALGRYDDKKGKCKILIKTYHLYSVPNEIADVCLIVTQAGQLYGKLIASRTTVKKGKNIGKANETTMFEQAKKELLATYVEDLNEYKTLAWYAHIAFQFDETLTSTTDRGPEYTIDAYQKRTKITYNLDRQARLKPMLAEKAKDYKGTYHSMFAQYKYNGVRNRMFLTNAEEITCISREGITYELPHLTTNLDKNYLKHNHINIMLDGELYLHGLPLQEITGLARINNFETTRLEYHCYDVIAFTYLRNPVGNVVLDIHGNAVMSYMRSDAISRNAHLKQVLEKISAMNKSFVLAPSYPIIGRTAEERKDCIFTLFDNALSEKYEGIMLRVEDGQYMAGRRSMNLLKVKKNESAEFVIRGIDYTDRNRLEDFSWRLETPQGKIFLAKAHGTIEQRLEYANHYERYLGKKMSLTFVEYSVDKIPVHISEIIIRDYE